MGKTMRTIQVLLSSYNGAQYLKEQIDSILAQDCERAGIRLQLLVRDDGSTDGTQEILEEYGKRYPDRIRWYQGENVGVIRSFFDLMQKAPEAEYYAFADQDDYWMPDKLMCGVEKLEEMGEDTPALYCCRPKLVDENLQEIVSAIKRPPVRAGFRNAMIENVVVGCTAVFNDSLCRLVVKRFPEFTVMHDWWLYLTASAFGSVYYDETPHICYRQHRENVLGMKTSRLAELKMRLRRYRGNRGNISRQLGELIRLFAGEYPDNENLRMAAEMVEVKASFFRRRRFLKKVRPYRQRKNDDRIFRMILWLGSY